MAYPIGFDLHLSAASEPVQHAIRVGDIVRQRSGGPLLWVNDVDGEHVYCAGFLDPFSTSGLEVVH